MNCTLLHPCVEGQKHNESLIKSGCAINNARSNAEAYIGKIMSAQSYIRFGFFSMCNNSQDHIINYIIS